jgi:hypothetical protein
MHFLDLIGCTQQRVLKSLFLKFVALRYCISMVGGGGEGVGDEVIKNKGIEFPLIRCGKQRRGIFSELIFNNRGKELL